MKDKLRIQVTEHGTKKIIGKKNNLLSFQAQFYDKSAAKQELSETHAQMNMSIFTIGIFPISFVFREMNCKNIAILRLL